MYENGRKKGFTLLEMLLALALAGATLSLSLYAFGQLSERRLLAQPLAGLVKTLRFARAAAMGGGHTVTICPSQDGAACGAAGYEHGWIVFVESDSGVAGVRDAGERILSVRGAFDPRVSLRSNTFSSHLTFGADGRASGNGRFVVCIGRGPASSVGVFVIRSGRFRVAAAGEIGSCLT